MKLFTAIPFFRIMIPFVAGILLSLGFDIPGIPIVCFIVLIFIIGGLTFFGKEKKILLLTADMFLLLYGITLVNTTNTANDAAFYGKQVTGDSAIGFVAVVCDLPVEKAKSMACKLEIRQLKTRQGFVPVSGTMMAYFKRPVSSDQLKAGKVLYIKSRISEVPAPVNPFEFNYKDYLRHKQIRHVVFVDPGAFAELPSGNSLNAVWLAGLACKKKIMDRLKHSALSENSYAICCALLTGYDDDIDKPVMEAFSHSGTLHVLSVSGLHTGLIYLVISFLFDLVDRKRRFKLFKFALVTVILWGFALITGFSAPVLRAVIMFNLFGLGSIFFRNDSRNQLNILLVSAFILLCYNPFFIADVGFLLSYFALAGLIYFQPLLSALWQPSNRLANYTWQSITASFAATLSTLPLTLFFFKQFPLWFFVCNLVVVPATFIILLLGLLVVLKLSPVALVINLLTDALISFINLFNSGRFGFIDNIHVQPADVLFLSLMIVLVSAAIHYRSYRFCAFSLFTLIAWQLISLFSAMEIKQHSLLSVYQLKGKSVIAVKNKTQVSLTAMDSVDHNFRIRPHLISLNYPEVGIKKLNYVQTDKESVLILNRAGAWPAIEPAGITTLVLANNFRLNATDLRRFKQLRTIVADGSNNSFTIRETEELCVNFGVDFYSTKRQGAYLLAL